MGGSPSRGPHHSCLPGSGSLRSARWASPRVTRSLCCTPPPPSASCPQAEGGREAGYLHSWRPWSWRSCGKSDSEGGRLATGREPGIRDGSETGAGPRGRDVALQGTASTVGTRGARCPWVPAGQDSRTPSLRLIVPESPQNTPVCRGTRNRGNDRTNATCCFSRVRAASGTRGTPVAVTFGGEGAYVQKSRC